MTPKIASDITVRDKTADGFKSAQKRGDAYAKASAKQAKQGGLATLGKQLDGLSKFKGVSFGFGSAGKSLTTIANVANDVGQGLGSATRAAVGFGSAGKGALAEVAEVAGVAATAIGATVAAVVGLAVATYALGDKWAKTGAEVGRTARTIGETTQELQNARAAGERYGVTTEAMTGSMDGLASSIYDAKSGANNLAMGTLNVLGIKLRKTKDGADDVAGAMYDISDAIARQTDPQVQRAIARTFGMEAALPALRQGSAALKAAGADYQASGASLTPAEVAKSTDVNRQTVALRQHLSAAEKTVGMGAIGLTGAAADTMLSGADALRKISPSATVTTLVEGAKALTHGGLEAGRHLIEGGRTAGRAIGEEFLAFAHRIEHQESRGHQFDRRGNPLTSAAGAVGVMQLMPDTAKAAAKRAGIPWDPERYKHDEGYNRQLGQAELAHVTAMFDGDEVLGAAAYNAGPGAVRRWVRKFGDPRKGEISDEDFAAKIPFQETRDYVQKTAHAHVTITLGGAPQGTVSKVAAQPGVSVDMHVARGLDGP